MDEQLVVARRLTNLARPYLERNDTNGLAERIVEEWSPECLRLLLTCDDTETVEIAVTCLGLIGDRTSAPALAELLHHADPDVTAAAENALWSIWFRAAGPMAQAVLSRVAQAITAGDTENVVPMLTELIRAYPGYAEAYHQRSQAHYLQNCYQLALQDARRAFQINPLHFGALANEAHALAALGRMREALKVYRQVLRLHPTMPGIREAIGHLRRRVKPIEV
ncbi:MAG TPA: HEAT repeat domain-containing protein [Phycisphaerae bacterium]|nr:HEAT repeat domain-containing protein [Phycisphaerae bacterium]